MPTALFSVSDKSGLAEFATSLAELGWSFIASGGTAQTLRQAGLSVTDVADVTQTPEMFGGRVKTLHPNIHGGILARTTAADQAELTQHGIQAIDMVVCNLYPFQTTVARPNITLNEAIEQIDIGGVTLLRAAAKNFSRVTAVCDPDDYANVIKLLQTDSLSEDKRADFARKAFQHTAAYDVAISRYLGSQADGLPEQFNLSLVKTQPMRYGENPHQQAALYASSQAVGPLGGRLLQGKPLSYNNMLDLDAAWRAAQAFDEPCVVIVKHLSPCGIAIGPTAAFPAALASDSVSAFGGVIALNKPVDEALATALGDLFVEAIAAPEFTETAQAMLAQRKNCRLIEIAQAETEAMLELRTVTGGLLIQTRDGGDPAEAVWEVVTQREPTAAETQALKFAWRACQHVKSNAIVLAHETATVGIGSGQPSRVDAVHQAITKAGEQVKGAVLASDAFFPFPDGPEAAAQAGISAIVQPGGSIRDEQVIEAANRLNVAMVFTKTRHFRH